MKFTVDEFVGRGIYIEQWNTMNFKQLRGARYLCINKRISVSCNLPFTATGVNNLPKARFPLAELMARVNICCIYRVDLASRVDGPSTRLVEMCARQDGRC